MTRAGLLPDFRDLLSALADSSAEYLVVERLQLGQNGDLIRGEDLGVHSSSVRPK
jgi:hypothetical protein